MHVRWTDWACSGLTIGLHSGTSGTPEVNSLIDMASSGVSDVECLDYPVDKQIDFTEFIEQHQSLIADVQDTWREVRVKIDYYKESPESREAQKKLTST